ncbi:MAG: DUF433 domain-containing protein [Bacteroidota bacterium]
MNKIITVDPEVMSGMPVFTGTRVPIKNLFDYLETGDTVKTFLDDFPSVTKEQAIGILELAEKIITDTTEGLNENIAR